jgi:cell division protein FtsZ
MQAQRQQPQAEAKHADPSLDDDQLTIPAFLRRQAN